jgi:Holin of 3TMs, for gene-transfer release
VSVVGDAVAGMFKPIADVIDHVLPSGDAKLALQQKVIEGQIAAGATLMDYERQLLDGQTKIITAEAQGNSWLQRSWRPITMLTFLALVVCDSFGWLHNPLAPQAWTLLQIGLGGYVAGRSLEKIAGPVAAAFKK